jgi:ADP-ribose pyrophosphatase
MREKTMEKRDLYENAFLSIHEDDVVLAKGKQAKRIVIDHIGAACVLPITDRGDVLLIEQYRYPLDEIVYEIPAGKKDEKDEPTRSCARRELEEETGYQSEKLIFLYEIYPCVGYSNETIDLYLALGVRKLDHPRAADDDEDINVLVCDRKKIERLFQERRIKDGKTMIALQYYLHHYDAIMEWSSKKG